MDSIVEGRIAELAELCRAQRVRRMELFGSAAEDRFDPTRSDLDFLIEFEPSTPVEHATRYFAVLAALQDMFERDVDLVEAGAIQTRIS